MTWFSGDLGGQVGMILRVIAMFSFFLAVSAHILGAVFSRSDRIVTSQEAGASQQRIGTACRRIRFS